MAKQNISTQNFVPIRSIKDGVVTLKNGQMHMVLLASSINFALKSTDEQAAILHRFQAFLNTIEFSIQVYVQSRRLDIQPYLTLLESRMPDQDNDLMRIQLREYMEFVRTFTAEVDVMSKNFFVVIPYMPFAADIKTGLQGMLGSTPSKTHTEERFEEHRLQLEQRMRVVEQGLSGMGVRTVLLHDDELVELYYHIFNPGEVGADAPTQK